VAHQLLWGVLIQFTPSASINAKLKRKKKRRNSTLFSVCVCVRVSENSNFEMKNKGNCKADRQKAGGKRRSAAPFPGCHCPAQSLGHWVPEDFFAFLGTTPSLPWLYLHIFSGFLVGRIVPLERRGNPILRVCY
jgi:hypothetical protein